MRVREDKTRIYRQGVLSKTLNDFSVACNIWRSIHNPISQNNIIGNEKIINNMDVAELNANDIYYSRTMQKEARLSHHMLVFHNHGVKDYLYSKPAKKGSIVELACGQGGDLNRWIKNEYRFVLGVDLVKNNIYSPNHGAYARLLRERKRFFINMKNNNNMLFPDMVFAVGDCAKSIKNGESKENVLDRLLPYYENDILYTLSENKLPLIVTHKHTARVLMKYLLKISDEEFENYDLPNKKILLIYLDNNLHYDSHVEI